MKRLASLLMVLCMVCGLLATAGAEDAEYVKVKYFNMTFQIPAWLEEDVEGCLYKSDSYTVYLVSDELDEDYVRGLRDEFAKEGYQFNIQQAAIMLAEYDWKGEGLATRFIVLSEAKDIGMLNGDKVYGFTASGDGAIAFLAQFYRGHYYSVLVWGQEGTSPEEVEKLCSDIMLSARIDGVSEEDMIADAQADYVIITADSGKIRTEASISGGLIKTAYKGETYELIEESGDWYIVDVDGRTGYIHKGVAAIQ